MPYKDQARRYATQAAHRLRNQQSLRAFLLENPCIDCGESDPIVLEFDHRDGVDKKFDVGRAVSASTRSWTTIKLEIDKCDVRCANCHRRRTAKQLNWYQYFASVD